MGPFVLHEWRGGGDNDSSFYYLEVLKMWKTWRAFSQNSLTPLCNGHNTGLQR